jgi:hypothetical protein
MAIRVKLSLTEGASIIRQISFFQNYRCKYRVCKTLPLHIYDTSTIAIVQHL